MPQTKQPQTADILATRVVCLVQTLYAYRRTGDWEVLCSCTRQHCKP